MQENHQIQIIGSFLRNVLLLNGISSGACGLIMIFFSNFVANFTGLNNQTLIVEIGIGLIIYVAFLFWATTKNSVRAVYVLLFAIVDFLWVIDSILLVEMSGTTYTMTYLGVWAVVLVAIVVGLFAILQFYYYWASRAQKQIKA